VVTVAKTCPSCGKAFKRRVKTGGGVISCPRCGNPTRLTAEERAAVDKKRAGPAPAGEGGDPRPGDQTHDTEAEDRRETEQQQDDHKPPPPAPPPKGQTEIGEREQEEGESDTADQKHKDEDGERHAGPVW